MSKFVLPAKIKIGGQEIEIKNVSRYNGKALGRCCLASGYIEIAKTFNDDSGDNPQTITSQENTFYHEVTHAILMTMGEHSLNENEKFISVFSSFLTEVMQVVVDTNKKDLESIKDYIKEMRKVKGDSEYTPVTPHGDLTES